MNLSIDPIIQNAMVPFLSNGSSQAQVEASQEKEINEKQRVELVQKLKSGEAVIVNLEEMSFLKIRHDNKQSDHSDLAGLQFCVEAEEFYPNYRIQQKNAGKKEWEKLLSSIHRLSGDFFHQKIKCAGGYPIQSKDLKGGKQLTLVHGVRGAATIVIEKIIKEKRLFPQSKSAIDDELMEFIEQQEADKKIGREVEQLPGARSLSQIQKLLTSRDENAVKEVSQHLTSSWRKSTNWFSSQIDLDSIYQKKIIIIWDMNQAKLEALEKLNSAKIFLFFDGAFFSAQPLPLAMARTIVIRDACPEANSFAKSIEITLRSIKELNHIHILRYP